MKPGTTEAAASPEHVRFNFAMGLIHGILFEAALAFSSPTAVLPVFLSHFTGSLALIGLFSAVVKAGGVLPQLIVAHRLQGRSQNKPVLVAAIWARAAAWGVLGGFTWLCADCGAAVLLGALLVLLLVFSIAGGVANVPFMELWGKALPARLRGRFWGHRQLWGGLLAVGAGYGVKAVLAADIVFPRSYAVLFASSFLLLALSYVALSSVREPAGEVSSVKDGLGRFLLRAVSLLRHDTGFVWLTVTQFATMFFGFAVPFYVLYGREHLGMPAEQVGILVAAQMVGVIVSNLLWGWLSDRFGNRIVIRLTAVATVAIPALALAGRLGSWQVLVGVFALIGAALSGVNIGFVNYVLEIAPAQQRPTYIAVNGTLNGLLAMLPIAGGWVVDAGSYRLAFWIAFGVSLLALGSSLKLRCLRPRGGVGRPCTPAAGASAPGNRNPGGRK
ncbi:MAG: MFS transporter [Spirochaetales bacterium]|nr:MFS transporter [Spirochaetales bacterium]